MYICIREYVALRTKFTGMINKNKMFWSISYQYNVNSGHGIIARQVQAISSIPS